MASNLRTVYEQVRELLANSASFQAATNTDSATDPITSAKKHVIISRGNPADIPETWAKVHSGMVMYAERFAGRPQEGSVQYTLYIPASDEDDDESSLSAIDICDNVAAEISIMLKKTGATVNDARLEWGNVEQVEPIVVGRLTQEDTREYYIGRYLIRR